MKALCCLSGIAIALALTGCSTTQVSVLPQANNQYQLISTASSSTDALNGAMDKAKEECKKTGQKPVVVSSSVKYQGMNQDTEQLAQMAATVINMNTNNFVPGPDTSQNYSATVLVQCQ